jgi:hypothetical protein
MLDDDSQADAYAHVQEAIDNWDSLLNVLFDTFLPEDIPHVKAIGLHMEKAKDVLNA